MENAAKDPISRLIERHADRLLDEWMRLQRSAPGFRVGPISESDLGDQSRRFLAAFRRGIGSGDLDDISGSNWAEARGVLEELSTTRGWAVEAGFNLVDQTKQDCDRRQRNRAEHRRSRRRWNLAA